MQNSYMLHWLGGVVGAVRPRVNSWRFGMSGKLEYLNDAIPNSFPAKGLFYGNTFDVRWFCTMQATNYFAQFCDVVRVSHLLLSSFNPETSRRITKFWLGGVFM